MITIKRILMNRSRFLLVVLPILFLLPPVVFGSSVGDDFQVEGIVFEEEMPEDSLVVINGDFVREGDEYMGYQIVKIGPERVEVRHLASGQDKTLWIEGGRPQKEEAVSNVSESSQKISPQQAKSRDESSNLVEEAMARFGGVMNMAYEAQAMAEMRKISSSAMVYAISHGVTSGLTIKNLMEAGVISGFSPDGVKGLYRYRIGSPGGEVVSVYADPVQEGSIMKHFFIDEGGNLYSETGKPASRQSQLHKPMMPAGMLPGMPAGMQNLPPESRE